MSEEKVEAASRRLLIDEKRRDAASTLNGKKVPPAGNAPASAV
jgi:hypothetical protein